MSRWKSATEHSLEAAAVMLAVTLTTAAVSYINVKNDSFRIGVHHRLQSLAPRTIVVSPNPQVPGASLPETVMTWARTVMDVEAVVPVIEGVAHAVTANGQTNVTVIATTPAYEDLAAQSLMSGHFLDATPGHAVLNASAAKALGITADSEPATLWVAGTLVNVVGITATDSSEPINTAPVVYLDLKLWRTLASPSGMTALLVQARRISNVPTVSARLADVINGHLAANGDPDRVVVANGQVVTNASNSLLQLVRSFVRDGTVPLVIFGAVLVGLATWQRSRRGRHVLAARLGFGVSRATIAKESVLDVLVLALAGWLAGTATALVLVSYSNLPALTLSTIGWTIGESLATGIVTAELAAAVAITLFLGLHRNLEDMATAL